MENCKFAKEHFAELTTFFICFILIWHFNSPRKIYMSNSRQKKWLIPSRYFMRTHVILLQQTEFSDAFRLICICVNI